MECAYDSMGRRFGKKVTVGGTTGFHARYLYRDYLQVAECDLTGETPVVVRSYIWDPSEPEATRVLSMTRWEANGTQEKEHLYCMHDAMKNVTSLFGEARGRRALYEYRPYGGLITSEGNMAEENKFRFSSEYMDDELGLVYYNYRHLNPLDGRWISRDPIAEQGGWNLYGAVENSPAWVIDHCGLEVKEESRPFAMRPKPDSNLGYTVIKDASFMDKDLEIEYDYKKEKNKCRVFVKNIKEPVLVILEYWPSEDEKIVGYSKKGVLAIIGHEKRRLQVYQKADKTYIKLVINNVKILYAEDESREKAEKKLNNYVQKYYDSAKDCLLRYAREQQELITQEAKEWNLIRGKLNNEVIGIKWTHKVSDPKPAPMPMLPEGLGRTGN